MTQMTKPDPRVEAVVRRLHDDACRGSLHLYATCPTWQSFERAVRAGLELAADYIDDMTDTDYPWRFADAIRALAKGGADE